MTETHSHDYWFGICACGHPIHPTPTPKDSK